MCCGLWLEKDYGKTAQQLMEDPAFVDRYVVDLALGLKAAIMLLNPARIVIGGGISKAGTNSLSRSAANCVTKSPAGPVPGSTSFPAALKDDSVLWGALVLAKTGVDK